ncbi:hypothetical protein GCM10020000_74330 [Streptomyces olivoverticillatus]
MASRYVSVPPAVEVGRSTGGTGMGTWNCGVTAAAVRALRAGPDVPPQRGTVSAPRGDGGAEGGERGVEEGTSGRLAGHAGESPRFVSAVDGRIAPSGLGGQTLHRGGLEEPNPPFSQSVR